ncbi:MAG TPA: universal stress protein [Actinospica sp.]|jgi:nucleotide-binding universal stress UspA family protein|nr:universal stress protein [Actinospica sp.]
MGAVVEAARSPFGVVVGVDASETSEHATAWAAREAAERGVPLTLAHARGGAGERVASALLDTTAERAASPHPRLDVKTFLSTQSPARILTELSLDAELVVTGTRGHGGYTGRLLGSVSGRLSGHAHCPVVIVRGAQPTVAKTQLVLGLEPDEDPAPIGFAFRTAAALGLSVLAVRACDADTPPRKALLGMNSLLRQERIMHPEIPITIEAVQGDPVTVLRRAARDARLIVLGTRRRGGTDAGPGRIAHGLLSMPGTPVALVSAR